MPGSRSYNSIHVFFRLIMLLFWGMLSGRQTFAQESILLPAARFHPGDNVSWKEADFDDQSWPLIKTTIRWEEQGYQRYDGYAWYRIRFYLPSSLKNNAYLRDTLSVLLSKIDEVDETFLNGQKIGQTGAFPTDPSGAQGKWDTYRVYNIASNNPLIRWDTENILAIRVLDFSNGGGMFGPIPSVRMRMAIDAVNLLLLPGKKDTRQYHASIVNTSSSQVRGVWTIRIHDGNKDHTLQSIEKPIILEAGQLLEEVIVAGGKDRLEVWSSFKEMYSAKSKSVNKVTSYILTPSTLPSPRINSPSVFGVRPGAPFIFKVAATGKKPLVYQAKNLPAGLAIDKSTGILTGIVKEAGDYSVTIAVTNSIGKAVQHFVIKSGLKLALTPTMGWNSWNCWGLSVTEEKVKESTQSIIKRGLIDHGWNYINIDDGWESEERSSDGTMKPNEKFRDMKLLGDWLHDRGLKFGIYSSPGEKTCGGYLGSYHYEEQDAAIYASWGVDFLKYDWCSYEYLTDIHSPVEAYQKPYKIMQAALFKQPRDIIYNLCQYGQKDVWKWGDSVNANSWRTTNDLKDTWESLRSLGFARPDLYKYAQPGNWNDPDMLMVGNVGGWSGQLRPSLLTADEQYTHVTLWCIMAAPLIMGCDPTSLDAFTYSLLTNDEVIAIDQDQLGKQGQQKIKTPDYEVWLKELQDGGKAMGVFNVGDTYQDIQINFDEIDLTNGWFGRDLWRNKNIGFMTDKYSVRVPPHGASFIKLTRQIIHH